MCTYGTDLTAVLHASTPFVAWSSLAQAVADECPLLGYVVVLACSLLVMDHQNGATACADEDFTVTVLSALRFAVLGVITAWNVRKHLPPGAYGKGRSYEFLHLCMAFRDFCLQEGEHMVLYFGTSCMLDTFAVFGVQTPPEGACRADMLAALYSAAVITCLPNAALAYWLCSTGRRGSITFEGIGWALVAIILAALSFWVRLTLVNEFHYVNFVHSCLAHLQPDTRAFVAGSTPPLVDLCQSLLLILAAAVTSEKGTSEPSTYYVGLMA